jgi:hypothetical protein
MDTKEKTSRPKLPEGYSYMDPEEQERIEKMDLFREKFDRMNEFIRRVGLPAELQDKYKLK